MLLEVVFFWTNRSRQIDTRLQSRPLNARNHICNVLTVLWLNLWTLTHMFSGLQNLASLVAPESIAGCSMCDLIWEVKERTLLTPNDYLLMLLTGCDWCRASLLNIYVIIIWGAYYFKNREGGFGGQKIHRRLGGTNAHVFSSCSATRQGMNKSHVHPEAGASKLQRA
jgi:hypothetical protein